ncbi:hypothetical protein IscW_ISCW006325 [Ixodes scapularis]|uniref:Uncharacterized protein n=1 Tax=Ixodes scapularis TaxID=6945 RepID=B7PMY5_IXOSC|nr:hypothetical protein IscW_ISCW006325 [Ixodes scapularis]|eukprot:XP_002435133.1 hypothetical protein IscW_ISCW006325 [Ixodes scapularis]
MRKDLWTNKRNQGVLGSGKLSKRPTEEDRTISLYASIVSCCFFLPCPFLPDEAGFDLTLCFVCVL